MFYTLILLAVMLYLFGCLSIELITNNAKLNSDPETMDLVATHFVFFARCNAHIDAVRLLRLSRGNI
jgi:hypothetical protein